MRFIYRAMVLPEEIVRHGGGVCIFIKNNLNFRLRDDLHNQNLAHYCCINPNTSGSMRMSFFIDIIIGIRVCMRMGLENFIDIVRS